MKRIRLGAPLSLMIAAGCVIGTYVPGAGAFGISGSVASLLMPLTWLKLITWPFIHADTGHLVNNMMLFLLLAPGLEEKHGAVEFLFCLLLTAVLVGVAHVVFGSSNTALIGASAWVFMMIILSTFTTKAVGTLSVPTLIVAVLYGWQEIRAAMAPTPISQFSHLLGGACGLLFGLLGRNPRAIANSVIPSAAR
ncbi:MAG: rhomboid family intramembrane serine protease [Opitutaceae bacterium]